METIFIRDDKDNIVIYLENDKYWGYTFYYNGKIESINEKVFKYFDMFKLSSDRTALKNDGEYQVLLDNKTNFKHYFLNGKEDFKMFFLNNGEDAIQYIKSKSEDNNRNVVKIFKCGTKKVITSLDTFLKGAIIGALITVTFSSIVSPIFPFQKEIINKNFNIEEIAVDDLRDKIYSSTNLSREEKDFLYNEELFSDLLPYINESNYLKYMFNLKFKDIDIDNYGKFDIMYYSANGYYNSLIPNIINISDYNELQSREGTVAHEFIHLCQDAFQYNVISESCAEIIAYEYYPNEQIDSYKENVYLVRKLMEIIGPEPVWEYTFTGNFDKIEASVKPYLSEKEYKMFLSCLSNRFDNFQKFDSLDKILDILYENKYGVSVENDEIIGLLNNPSLVRYYFNHRRINQEYSYYEVYNKSSVTAITLEEAMEMGLIVINLYDGEKRVGHLSYEDYVNNNYNSNFEIRYETKCEYKFAFNNINEIFLFDTERVSISPISEKFPDVSRLM